MKLFMEQDVALQFDISKEIQLEYVLLSIEKSSNGGALKSPPLFRLSTSTEENIVCYFYKSTILHTHLKVALNFYPFKYG